MQLLKRNPLLQPIDQVQSHGSSKVEESGWDASKQLKMNKRREGADGGTFLKGADLLMFQIQTKLIEKHDLQNLKTGELDVKVLEQKLNRLKKADSDENLALVMDPHGHDTLAVDQIYKLNRRRIENQLMELEKFLAPKVKSYYYNKTINLHTEMGRKRHQDKNDLQWLLKKTRVTEVPGDAEREELKRICIQNGINNPIVGEELYDPNAFDMSKEERKFGDKIQQICAASDKIYYRYRKDRREVLEQSELRSEKYLNKKKEEIDLVKLKVKLAISELLDMKMEDLKKLNAVGFFNKKKQREYLNEKMEQIRKLDNKKINMKSTGRQIKEHWDDYLISMGILPQQRNARDSNRSQSSLKSTNSGKSARRQSGVMVSRVNHDGDDADGAGGFMFKRFLRKARMNKAFQLRSEHTRQRSHRLTQMQSFMNTSLFTNSKISTTSQGRETNYKHSLKVPRIDISQLNAADDNEELFDSIGSLRSRSSTRQVNAFTTQMAKVNLNTPKKSPKNRVSTVSVGSFQGLGDKTNHQMNQTQIASRKGGFPAVDSKAIRNNSQLGTYQGSPNNRILQLKNEPITLGASMHRGSVVTSRKGQTTKAVARKDLEFRNPAVPSNYDEEIQSMIKRYPIKKEDDLAKDQTKQMLRRRKQRRTQLNDIIRLADFERKDLEEQIQRTLQQQVNQNIRTDEFFLTLQVLKDLDFASPEIIKTLFKDRLKDELAQIDTANEQVEKYHSGKYDPGNRKLIERAGRKKNRGKKGLK